jgi:hypothetical protein
MRSVKDLLKAEVVNEQIHYGGWWFYAFSINEVKHYAFPFFVRGDDIQFGLLNKHTICSMNGIGCWGDDFGFKNGPLPMYLDTRNHLIQKIAVLNAGCFSTILVAIKFFVVAVLSYNYAMAQSVTLALTHVLKGSQFWIDNIDMVEIREQIGAFSINEKMMPINLSSHKVKKPKIIKNESGIRYIFRLTTFNGFLLPSFCLKNRMMIQEKGKKYRFNSMFRYKKILHYYPPYKLGYITEHNKLLFFKELFRFIWQILLFILRFSKLKKEYQKNLPYLTSEKFWREVYKL